MPDNRERERLDALRALGVLDTAQEAIFDSLTQLAATIFRAPIALVSLLDERRQWFKSCIGLNVSETDRDVAFCDHAIRHDEPLVVLDATQDPRFAGNPLVTGPPYVRFYAGAPLILSPGIRLGTLCIIDTEARAAFDQTSAQQLSAMAATVTAALAMRRDISTFHDVEREREERDQLLNQVETIAGVGHWSMGAQTGTTTWSPAVYAIHGMDASAPSPDYEQAIALYEPEDQVRLASLVQRALTTGEAYRLQTNLTRPDGSIRTVRISGEARRDGAGEITGLAGVFMDVTDVVQVDRDLRINESRLRFLTEHSADIIMRLAPKQGVTWISPSVRRFGYEPEQLQAKAVFDFIHPDDLPAVRSVQRALLGGADQPFGQHIRFRLRRVAGGWHWFEISATLVRDESGQPVEVVNVLRDISDRVAAEEALMESEARFRTLSESASDIITRFGTDARFTYLSPSVEVALGYTPAELMGRSTRSIMHPEDYAASLRVYQEHLAGELRSEPFKFEYRALHKDGSVVWLAGHPRAIFDPASGVVIGFQDVVRNVTPEREIEAELARSEVRFRLLAENASDLIMESRADGTLRYISPSCLRLTGYLQGEVIGQPAARWVHPEDWPVVVTAFRAQVASRGEAAATPIEYRLVTKSGAEIWMESAPHASVNPVTDELTVTDVARDVTGRRQVAAALAAARDAAESATQVKADFLANMTHELRSPLTSLLGFTQRLEARDDLHPEARRSVQLVSAAGQALLATVNEVLDFSKLEAGLMTIQPRPTQVRERLQDALSMFEPQASAKGLSLFLSVPEDLPVLDTDPERLRQILFNFIGNAVKFTDHGAITVTATYDPDLQRLRVEVRDTGPGLDEKQQADLFKRYSQVDGGGTKRTGGTGLGLAISRGLAEAMTGEVGVISRPGEGAVFWFTVKAAQAAQAPETAQVSQDLRLDDIRVLVADDNARNRELVRAILMGCGAEVREAADGQEAVDASMVEPVDVILMDMRMPVCDGLQAAVRIRSSMGPNQRTPILVFSADPEVFVRDPVAAKVFDGVVPKPIMPMDLIAAVYSACDYGGMPATGERVSSSAPMMERHASVPAAGET